MQRNLALKNKVQSLRKTGKTFGEIQIAVGIKIPKSTLSNWCKNIPLPPSFQKRLEKINYINLRKANQLAIEKARIAKLNLLKDLRKNNNHLLSKIDKSTGKMLLAMLYLGEGAKRDGILMLGSSDVNIIKLFLRLLEICYRIDRNLIKCRISYRADQNINELTTYWSKTIKVPIKNFYKTIPDPRTINHKTKKADYKGVCVIHILQSSKIQLELKIISEIIMGR